MNPADVPVPRTMRHLPKDRRGYPIPAGVLIDPAGKPHFTINDEATRRRQMAERLCPICDKKLGRWRMFVGGPQSAFHQHGAYIDLPMHVECAHYALQVCPYLAAPVYTGRIDDRTLKVEPGQIAVMINQTMLPDRPLLFVAVLARSIQRLHRGQYVRPQRPYVRVEFWRHGVQLDEAEGLALAQEALAVPIPHRQGPSWTLHIPGAHR
jgi:hypothetical protein